MSQPWQEQTAEQEGLLLSGANLKVEAMNLMDEIKKFNKTGQLPAGASGSGEQKPEEIPAGQPSPEGRALPTKQTSNQTSNQLSNQVRNQARQQSISLSMNQLNKYKTKPSISKHQLCTGHEQPEESD